MPFFQIYRGTEDVAVCQDATIEDVKEGISVVLGEGEFTVKEITEEEAEAWAQEYVKTPNPEDICPICESPRLRSPRGEIVIKVCNNCGLES